MDPKNVTVFTSEQLSAYRKVRSYALLAGIAFWVLFFLITYSPHADITSPRSSLFFCIGFGLLLAIALFFVILVSYSYYKGLITLVNKNTAHFNFDEYAASPIESNEYHRLEWYNDVSNPANPAFQAHERAVRHD